jgi:SAM-dependent methyltransferase
MVTRDDVITAYRLILGREPESEEVVTSHVNNTATIAELRDRFFSSPEFVEQNTSGIMVGRHYVGAPMAIDVAANRAKMTQMFGRIGQVWQAYGTTEPYWSVLTLPQFKLDTISDADVERFYGTGADNLQIIRAFFARNHERLDGVQHVLEFGCGIGRTTFALAATFPRVVGVDISSQHLAHAKRRQSQIEVGNVEFVHVQSMEVLGTLPQTDFVYSVIVLQHNPPPIIEAALQVLLSKVRKGGFALFQIPTYKAGYSFDISHYLDHPVDVMEMHVLEARKIFSILKSLDFDVLEVHEDYCVGSPAFMSHTFFVRR